MTAVARRVVSLVPSVTETLFHLGAGGALVARTRFCIHPGSSVGAVPIIGGTKDPDVAAILALRPDLVLANREENREEDVVALRRGVPVHVSYPRDLPSLFAYLAELGAMLGCESAAAGLTARISAARDGHAAPASRLRVLYLIWRDPWMAAAPDTFVDAMLRACGFDNVVPGGGGRYPCVDVADVAARGVDLVLLSSEPFPFGERHRAEIAGLMGLGLERVQCASGEAFSWFGTRTATVFDEAGRILRATRPSA